MTAAGDTETVTVIVPPGRDRFGDPLSGSGTETPVAGCLIAPGRSAEDTFGSHQVDTDLTVYAPAGTVVASTDRVRVRGLVYGVVGEAQVWGTSGVVVALRRVTG